MNFASLRQRAFVSSGIAFAIAFAVLAPAHAGLFDDDEARKQIIMLRNQLAETQKALDTRVGELESQARNRSIIDLFNQVETLRAEFARLRGQIEIIQNELETTQKRQRDLYVDLDGRMRKMEAQQQAADQIRSASPSGGIAGAPGAAPVAPTLPASAPQVPVVDPTRGAPPAAVGGQPPVSDPAQEQRMYDLGLDHFRASRFAEAVTAFQLFTRTYPRSTLASSAQYWIGNSLYATRDFRGAINAQRQLITQFPDSTKAPDALLNVASSQSELGDLQGARTTLQEVNTKYPSSEAAAKARQRLGIR